VIETADAVIIGGGVIGASTAFHLAERGMSRVTLLERSILIIGATAWMELARILRNQTLSLRHQDFVQAAQALGASNSRIILRHLLPNSLAPILVAASLNIANAVLAESYISYLGYGIQPPEASWGNMLNNAQSYFRDAPWIALFPGLFITLTVIGFNFVGDGLRDALDPRARR
jgi:peptide/nickel transport system permease protein